MSEEPDLPSWLEDITRSLPARPQFMLWGNVHDEYLIDRGPHEFDRLDLIECLGEMLREAGYRGLICWDPTRGLLLPADDHPMAAFLGGGGAAEELLDARLVKDAQSSTDFRHLGAIIRRVAMDAPGDQLWGVAILRASRICKAPASPSDAEHELFTVADFASKEARLRKRPDRPDDPPVYNPIMWIADREGDLPSWLSQNLRPVAIPLPNSTDVDRMAKVHLAHPFWGFQDDSEASTALRARAHRRYVGFVQGLPLRDLVEINRLARVEGFTLDEVDDAVRSFRAGVRDNPWRRGPLLARIAEGEAELGRRVLGQPVALERTLDLLKRSAMGLTGAHTSSSASRPRGVLFFAGPSGVGKTELAKAIAELVFGDSDAYVRFDMSEFKSEGSDQRLIGAPPGYVGYEAGGELTSAIRARPFSLVLFDEIDKANPLLLDKFLQVLEDGRLTDGKGDTVSFSEALIVFTSNKGIIKSNGESNVTFEDPYDVVDANVNEGIKEFFTNEIQRPELLNRLGENIVVFDFIRSEPARQIFDGMLDRVIERVRAEHKVSITLDPRNPGLRDQLFALCWSRPEFGGRGIGNQIERVLTDPLARTLFSHRSPSGGLDATSYVIGDVRAEGRRFVVDLVPG